MSGCPECGSEGGGFGRLCPNCLGSKRGVQLRQREQRRADRRDARVKFLLGIWNQLPKNTIILIVLIFLFFGQKTALYGSIFGYGSVPKVDLPPGQHDDLAVTRTDPCLYKERCVIVYVAPWCPACHGAVDFLNALTRRVQRSAKVGMKIIIGMDARPKLTEMSRLFVGPTFLDDAGKFQQSLRVQSVPTAWVADHDGKILRSVPASLSGNGSEDEIFEYYNKNYLKLTEYLR